MRAVLYVPLSKLLSHPFGMAPICMECKLDYSKVLLILLLSLAAAQLLPSGAATIFKLLANGWCRWEIFGKGSIQFSKRVPEVRPTRKCVTTGSILADNPLATKFAICLCNSK